MFPPISYKTTPKENKSVRVSGSFARACSGDMYAMVPKVLPGLVSWLLHDPARLNSKNFVAVLLELVTGTVLYFKIPRPITTPPTPLT